MAMGKVMPPGGKGLGAILALGAPPKKNPALAMADGDGPDAEGDNDFDAEKKNGADDMLVGAAHDVMSSLRARDAEGFALALKDFVGMC